MKVAETMQRRVATVHPSDELDRAARLMSEHRCGSVVVVDVDDHPLGMLTDRDICMAALRTGRALAETQVVDAMSDEVFCCGPDDTVEEATDRMAWKQVRRLPVVDDAGHLVGVLALDDLAREACADAELLLPPVSYAGVGRALGQIARPHLIGGAGGEALR